jgi:hypothetical protein
MLHGGGERRLGLCMELVTSPDSAMLRVMEVMLQRAKNEEGVGLLDAHQCVTAGRVVGLGFAEGAISYRRDRLTILPGVGVKDDAHSGRTARVRAGNRIVRLLAPAVSTQANICQLRMVSLEDSAVIAQRMRLPAPDDHVPFGLQAENIVVEGFNLQKVLPGMRLAFVLPGGQVSPLVLYVTGAALPSETPISTFNRHYRGHGIDWLPPITYPNAAVGHSGLSLMVEAAPPKGAVITDNCFVVAFMPNK